MIKRPGGSRHKGCFCLFFVHVCICLECLSSWIVGWYCLILRLLTLCVSLIYVAVMSYLIYACVIDLWLVFIDSLLAHIMCEQRSLCISLCCYYYLIYACRVYIFWLVSIESYLAHITCERITLCISTCCYCRVFPFSLARESYAYIYVVVV